MAMTAIRLLSMLMLYTSASAFSMPCTGIIVRQSPQITVRAASFMQENDLPEDSNSFKPKPPSTADTEQVRAVESESVPTFEFDADEGSIAKEALKAEVGDGMAGARPDKAVIGEILLALESSNPTRSPATSPLLNGKWKVLYASGATPSLKVLMLIFRSAKYAPKSPSGADLLDVQDAFVTIREEQPRVEGSLRTRLLSYENTIKLTSKLEAESAVRLVETYDAAKSEYMNLRLPFQSPVQYKRSILVSYLDEELMVVRDALGRPDILMRVDESSRSSTTNEGEVSTSSGESRTQSSDVNAEKSDTTPKTL